MRYICLVILSLLALTSCCPEATREISYQEFTYGQTVKIVSGFYKGAEAEVVEEGMGYSGCYRTYKVYIRGGAGYQTLCNSRMEARK